MCFFFFFSSRRRHTRCYRDWSSDVCSSDLAGPCRCRRSGRSRTRSRAGRRRRRRSEERRVGKECRSRWSPYQKKKKIKQKAKSSVQQLSKGKRKITLVADNFT